MMAEHAAQIMAFIAPLEMFGRSRLHFQQAAEMRTDSKRGAS